MTETTSNVGGDGLLLTGATGFLGGELLARLLADGERPIYALIRAGGDEAASERLREVIAALLGRVEPYGGRALAVAGDVTEPDLGLDRARRGRLAERVGRVIHCAASVSFDLDLDDARQINVEGTRRMLDFAQLCHSRGGIDSFVHVSTAYVAGATAGTVAEQELEAEPGFRNSYEQSKHEAELIVRERAGALPVQVVRPSIVVGDSRTGWTPAFNVLYSPLKAFSRGAFPLLPARRSSPVDVVPVDYVADAVLALAGRPGATHHLTAGERASSVGEVIELASSRSERPAPRVIPPPLYRRIVHPILTRTGSPRRRRALRRSEVFFPYFSMRTRYDDRRARAALAPFGIEAPALHTYFDRLLDFADAAEWGKRTPPRHEAIAAAPAPSRPRRRGAGDTVRPRWLDATTSNSPTP